MWHITLVVDRFLVANAFDLISRVAMLDGLSTVEGDFLCCRSCFNCTPNFRNISGLPPGSEQGDALMPMLHVLGQHGVLESIQESLHL